MTSSYEVNFQTMASRFDELEEEGWTEYQTQARPVNETTYVNETSDLNWANTPIADTDVKAARTKQPKSTGTTGRKVRGRRASTGIVKQVIEYLKNWQSSPAQWLLAGIGLKVLALAPVTPTFIDLIIGTLLNPFVALISLFVFHYVFKRHDLVFHFSIGYVIALAVEQLWKL